MEIENLHISEPTERSKMDMQSQYTSSQNTVIPTPMARAHKHALRACWPQLVQDTVPEDLIVYLWSTAALTQREHEHIKDQPGQIQKTEALLWCLIRKPDQIFWLLVAGLRDTGQEHLANMLLNQVRKREYTSKVASDTRIKHGSEQLLLPIWLGLIISVSYLMALCLLAAQGQSQCAHPAVYHTTIPEENSQVVTKKAELKQTNDHQQTEVSKIILETGNMSLEQQREAFLTLEKKIEELEERFKKLSNRQNTLEKMVMLLWSGFSRNTDEGDLTPATILFCVMGAMRFMTLIKCILHWEMTSSFTRSLLVLHCMQLVKDWHVAGKVERNRIYVQAYVASYDHESLAILNYGMVDLRQDVLLYLAILVLPLSIIWFQWLRNGHIFPKFNSCLSTMSYSIVLFDWVLTTSLIAVCYTSPTRFVYRYATVNQLLSILI